MIISSVTVRRISHPGKGGSNLRTALVQVVAVTAGGVVTGFGEIRAGEERYRESLVSACRFVEDCGSSLTGRQLRAESGAEIAAVRDLVTAATRESLGLLDDAPLGRFVHRPSRFALEVALLDVLSQARATSMAALISSGSTQKATVVSRNVEAVAPVSPLALYGTARTQDLRGQWLRLQGVGGPQEAVAMIQAVHDAATTSSRAPEGIWLELSRAWQPHHAASFLDLYARRFGGAQKIPLLLQDPLVSGAAELDWLLERIAERQQEAGFEMRVLLSEPVWGLHSLGELAGILSSIDLGICPQRAGGVAEILDMVSRYRTVNSDGRVHLYTHGRSTELNTVTLAQLAAAIPAAHYFSAKLRRRSAASGLYPRPGLTPGGAFDFLDRPGLGCAPLPVKSAAAAVELA